jgi:hypothetical protein
MRRILRAPRTEFSAEPALRDFDLTRGALHWLVWVSKAKRLALSGAFAGRPNRESFVGYGLCRITNPG